MVQRLFKQFKEDSAHQIGCLFFFSFSKGGWGNFLGIFRKKVPDNFQNKQICIWEPFFKKCGKLFGENYWGIPMLSAILPSLLTGYTGSLVSAYKIRFWPKNNYFIIYLPPSLITSFLITSLFASLFIYLLLQLPPSSIASFYN